MTDAREIIARAYDREDAAQRGEPDPWHYGDSDPDGDETGWREERIACAQCVIDALTAAGYRILSPGQVDKETLELAAKCGAAWDSPAALRLAAGEMTAQEMRTARAVARGIAAAIRALSPKGDHNG